jgi:2-haloacid dehalogenase
MNIHLVVFDLGGVMIRLAAGWHGACAEAGVAYRPLPETPDIQRTWQALEEGFNAGAIERENYYQGIYDLLDGLYSVGEIQRVYQAIIREEFPGIFDTVAALKNAGLSTACLSNTCAAHWDDLANPALYPGIGALDYQHASHLLHATKPGEMIYRRFEAATGASGAAILFFDDRAENIATAWQLGWHAVQITPERPSVVQIHETLATHGLVL